jgi:curved DNA-binding protein CbpA
MTHYEVLEVAPGTPTAEIRRAYLRLARAHHPDRGSRDPERMRQINAAWAVLGDDARRAAYDAELAAPSPTASSSAPTWTGAEDRWDPADLDDLADLDDDRPIGTPAPRWLAMLPVGTLAASVATVALGSLLRQPAVLGAAAAMFAASVVLFLILPFIALTAARRADRANRAR